MTSLQCYDCRTDYSWEKCDYIRTESTCPASKPKCIKLHARNKTTKEDTYIKGCSDSNCTVESICTAGTACVSQCCDGYDFCNRGRTAFDTLPTKHRTLPPPKTTASAAAHLLDSGRIFMTCALVVCGAFY